MISIRRSFFRMHPKSQTPYTQWMRDVWANKFLFWSVIFGFVTVFPVVCPLVLDWRVVTNAIVILRHRFTSLSLTTKSSNTHPSPGNGVSCLSLASCSWVQSKRGSMLNDSISDARIINLESAEVKRWTISDTYRCCLFNAGLRFRSVY